MKSLPLSLVLPVLSFLPLPLLTGSGCVTNCTTNLVWSVEVTVVDANGAPVPDAMVTFTVDGGSSQACSTFGDNGLFHCGEELAGHFVIAAEENGASATAEVDVDATTCHVEQMKVTIKLPAS
jgi:hypothetical protein